MKENGTDGQLGLMKLPAIALQHLRFALVVSDCGSFRRAAHMLSMKHSALSRSVSLLESLIGTAIFERSRGGVTPTPAGRNVLRIARLIMEQVETLVEIGRSGQTAAGRVSIGFCTSLSAGNLRATLLDFKARFPQIEPATIERSRIHLMACLSNGAVDIVVGPSGRLSSRNQALPLWSERVLLSLPEDHVLAACEVVPWTNLRDQTLLLSQRDHGHELEDLLVSKLMHPKDRPRIERHDVSRGTLKSLVSMGLGVSLVLESEIGASCIGLTYRDLYDGSGACRLDFFAEWRADNENPALKSFLQLLAERYPSPSSPLVNE